MADRPETLLSEAVSELAGIEPKARAPFPIEYFSKDGSKTRRLVETPDGRVTMRADNRWYSAHFDDPQIVSSVRVYHDNFDKPPNFNFAFRLHSDGKIIRVKRSHISHGATDSGRNYVQAKIFQFVSDISFEPPKHWLRSRVVTGIHIFGYSQEEFETVSEMVFQLVI